jgi:dTMP kinase
MHKTQKGLFIVIEGIDCSGSSTQARLLTANLRKQGRKVFLTSEPSNGPVGQLVRLYFSGRLPVSFTRAAQDKFFACLFAADRLDHIFNPLDGVIAQQTAGHDVVSTRYRFSSLAYNAETEDEREFVLAANSELPNPDILFYLKCPIEVSLSRMRERVTRETYEKDVKKLEKALANFDHELERYLGAKMILDATSPPGALAKRIIERVQDHRGVSRT